MITPLHWAALRGHTEAVILLLDKGADMDCEFPLSLRMHAHALSLSLSFSLFFLQNTLHSSSSHPLLSFLIPRHTPFVLAARWQRKREF